MLSKIFRTFKTPFCTVSEVFQKISQDCQRFSYFFHISFKVLKNGFEVFLIFSEISGDFWALPKIFLSFLKIWAWDKIVMQCFLVVYCGTCHLSLVFSSYTHSPKGSCVYGKYKWQVACSTDPIGKHCMTSMCHVLPIFEYQEGTLFNLKSAEKCAKVDLA